MNDGLISKRYAKALLEFAAARGEDKLMYESMKLLSESIAATPRLRETLQSPVVATGDKEALLCSAAGATAGESYRRFVRLALENRREGSLQNIALSYLDLYRRVHRIGRVSVVSATPLSGDFVGRIRYDVERRTRGTVELDVRVDPSLGGGFIFQMDDFRVDASVAGQLEKIRRQLASI
ncbi:MAG: F0F1 ATP synthase subunit delta [Prevotellaceae bacterium]|jgi:F-type H+-transporting ATPase subunit delta|nr:F0F1 ATP synthase subunit delta [Prevotellaceae bacterium]